MAVTSSRLIVIDFSNRMGSQQNVLLDNAVGRSGACMLCYAEAFRLEITRATPVPLLPPSVALTSI